MDGIFQGVDGARAAAYAESLAHGFREPREVLPWLDALIARTPNPPDELLEVALTGDDRHRLIGSLHGLADGADPS